MNNIPQPIKTVVTKPQEKLYVLRLEKDLIAFIKESILLKLESPLFTIHAGVLKNSYYRLLSHQVCQHYHLQHWNNGSNDIIVTLSADGFDYEKFSDILDLKEDNSFTKICDYLQQKKNGSNGISAEGDEVNTKMIRPRVIIKKESPKGSMPLADTLSEITQMSVFLTTIQNGRAQNDFSDTPNTSTPVLASSFKSGSDDIEHERASKEALYMKVREKIFQDQQDEENVEDEDDDDDDEEEEEEEDDDDDDDDSDEDIANCSTSDSKSGFMSQDNTRKHNGYNALDPNSYQYNGTSHGVSPVPMGIPLNYNANMNVPPFVNPNGYYNSPNQSMHSPQMNIYNQYANYFPAPLMMPPQNGFYSNAYNGNHHYTPYDKETERKLLNNPYIIIPDSNRDKKPKKPHKGRYTNGNSNSSSSTSNITSNNPTKY